jgi:hypothetical protein
LGFNIAEFSPPEALIKNPFRFFTKSSGSFSKVNILEAAIPLLKESEK